MATQFVAAFILISLVVFLGVVMTVGLVSSKAKRRKASGQLTESSDNT
jgi:nitrogen fixation protein FixH